MSEIVALLTGRGNNTLEDKNVLPVFGRPLIQYPGLAARACKRIDSFWVSSDCEKILTAAEEVGYNRIERPKEYARPDSQHVDVIDHSIGVLAAHDITPTILVVLLANSVTVKTQWIDQCIDQILSNDKITACVPVYREMDHHPYRAKTLNTDGDLVPFFDFGNKKISTNRQDLPPAFFLSHNFWVLNLKSIDRETGQQPWFFMGDKIRHIEVDEAFDVHTMEDVRRSEKWLLNQGISYE